MDVKRAGEYTVELRRWPKEADAAITASMKAGADVPGVTPFRAVDGKPFAAAKALKLGGQELTLPVKPNAKSVTFKLKLKPGRDELWAKFTDAEGTHGRILCVCDKTKVSLSAYGAHAVCKPQWDNLKIIIYRSS